MSTFVTEERYGPHTGQLLSSGAFVATGVSVARTGWKAYRESELFPGGSSRMVDVYTSAEELFSPLTIASGESKPVTLNHPWQFVTPFTWKGTAVGHMVNVRKGTEPLEDGNYPLVADVVVADVTAIDAVKAAGIRGTSLGYECEYSPLDNGTFEQRRILINHVALVGEPRTRNTRIEDAAMEYSEEEIQNALAVLAQQEQYLAMIQHGQRFDVGVKHGLFTAQLALAMNGQDRDEVLTQLIQVLATRNSLTEKGAGA